MRDPNQIPIGALSLQPETHGLGGTFFSRKGISNCSLVSRDAPQTSDKSWEDSPAERKRRGTRMECLEQRDCGGGGGDGTRGHTCGMNFQQQMAVAPEHLGPPSTGARRTRWAGVGSESGAFPSVSAGRPFR